MEMVWSTVRDTLINVCETVDLPILHNASNNELITIKQLFQYEMF